MSLHFNMLSRLVTVFFQGTSIFSFHGCSHHLQRFWSPQNKVSHCFHCFPICLPWSDGTRCHDLRFLNVEFWASFSTLLFTFVKRLFGSSSLSALSVVSPTYLRLLIFLLAVLIPACASSSLAFFMMYSTYKLNKQGDNIQPWRTPFLVWNQSGHQF